MKAWMKKWIGMMTPRQHMLAALIFALVALPLRAVGLEWWSVAFQFAAGVRFGMVLLGHHWKVWEDA